MKERSPLEQLKLWLQRFTTDQQASLVIDHISGFVKEDLEKMLGEDSKVAISVVEPTPQRNRPDVFIDLVFPWEEDSGLENSQKVNELISSVSNRVLIPLRNLIGRRGLIAVHSWCYYQGGESDERALIKLMNGVHVPPLNFDYENPGSDPFNLSKEKTTARKAERFIGIVSPRILRATGI